MLQLVLQIVSTISVLQIDALRTMHRPGAQPKCSAGMWPSETIIYLKKNLCEKVIPYLGEKGDFLTRFSITNRKTQLNTQVHNWVGRYDFLTPCDLSESFSLEDTTIFFSKINFGRFHSTQQVTLRETPTNLQLLRYSYFYYFKFKKQIIIV